MPAYLHLPRFAGQIVLAQARNDIAKAIYVENMARDLPSPTAGGGYEQCVNSRETFAEFMRMYTY